MKADWDEGTQAEMRKQPGRLGFLLNHVCLRDGKHLYLLSHLASSSLRLDLRPHSAGLLCTKPGLLPLCSELETSLGHMNQHNTRRTGDKNTVVKPCFFSI